MSDRDHDIFTKRAITPHGTEVASRRRRAFLATTGLTGARACHSRRPPRPPLPRAAELREHRAKAAGHTLTRVQPDAFVLTTSRGRPHGRGNVLRAVYVAGDAAGLNGDGRERARARQPCGSSERGRTGPNARASGG
jgi:hypothetical protein